MIDALKTFKKDNSNKTPIIAFFSSNSMCPVCQQMLLVIADKYQAKLIVLSKTEHDRQTQRCDYITFNPNNKQQQTSEEVQREIIRLMQQNHDFLKKIRMAMIIGMLNNNNTAPVNVGELSTNEVTNINKYINQINKKVHMQKVLIAEKICMLLKNNPEIKHNNRSNEFIMMNAEERLDNIFFIQYYGLEKQTLFDNIAINKTDPRRRCKSQPLQRT